MLYFIHSIHFIDFNHFIHFNRALRLYVPTLRMLVRPTSVAVQRSRVARPIVVVTVQKQLIAQHTTMQQWAS